MSLSVTPKILLPSVWPSPRSLATTSGISVDVFSSPYLDVSVQAVPLIYLFDSVYDTLKVGFPIRKSPDHSSFAAPRSLSQLITSFIGSWCQGIPLALLLAWSIRILLLFDPTIKKSPILVLFTVRIMQAQFQKFLKQNCIYYPLNFKSFSFTVAFS